MFLDMLYGQRSRRKKKIVTSKNKDENDLETVMIKLEAHFMPKKITRTKRPYCIWNHPTPENMSHFREQYTNLQMVVTSLTRKKKLSGFKTKDNRNAFRFLTRQGLRNGEKLWTNQITKGEKANRKKKKKINEIQTKEGNFRNTLRPNPEEKISRTNAVARIFF